MRTLFGVPGGGGNLDLIEAAGRRGLPFVLTSTETGGALAAIAQAEITGRPGACLTTLGPGAASVVNGVACAFLDRAPLVVFTDSHAAAAERVRAPATRPGGAVRADHEVVRPLASDERAAHARARVRRPCSPAARTGAPRLPRRRCGHPPADLASLATQRPSVRDTGDCAAPRRDLASPGARRTDLRDARKPLLLVGLGARRREDAAAIRSFCERRSVPAMVTYKAKGVVPDDHPWFAGVFTNGAIEQPLIDESDLLIGVGLDPVELLPRRGRYAQPIVYCRAAGAWSTTHVPFAAQLVTDIADGRAPSSTTLLAGRSGISTTCVERVRETASGDRCPPTDGLDAHSASCDSPPRGWRAAAA